MTSGDYDVIIFSHKKKSKCFCIHVLVANVFIERNPDKEVQALGFAKANPGLGEKTMFFPAQVNHLDRNKKNNYLGNLEFCTRTENVIHALGKKVCHPSFRERKV